VKRAVSPRAADRRWVLSILAAWLVTATMSTAAAAAPTVQPQDMTLGNPRAKVTVIEYASASCPHCARFNNNVFPDFKKKYIDSGKVLYVYREYLTEPVEVAAAGALLARCAGKAKYFQVLDDFFHGQAVAYETGDIKTLILSVGTKAGLTEAQIQACLEDEAANKALNERVEHYSQADGVQSTPTFVINGAKLADLDHEVQLTDLDAAIGPLLRAKKR
jgi:protein-disulfide isomerase